MNQLFVELLAEAEMKKLGATMVDHIRRLQSKGGKVIGEITKGHEIGYVGINGTGKSAVKFAFYPDHTYDRLEGGTKIRPGWSDMLITDLDLIAKDRIKAERLDKAAKKELLFATKIRVSEDELKEICKKSGIHLGGEIGDMWPDEDDYEEQDGRLIATVTYTITLLNDEYKQDGDIEYHDPFDIVLKRDSKNPSKIHAFD